MTIERVNNKSVISFEEKYGNTFSLMLAASGVFAFSIHSYFILNGRTEFTQPASLALLVIILIVSLVQGFVAFSGMHVTNPGLKYEACS